MTEQFANLAQTTVAIAGYTSGSGVLNVASTASPFPSGGLFTVAIADQSTGAVKVLLRVSAVNSSTQWAVSAEGSDANANASDLVYCVESAASFTQLKTDVEAQVKTDLTTEIVCVIDGGGSVPATGSKGFIQVPFGCTVLGWTMLADVSGSAQITVKKSTYSGFPSTTSIVASAQPALSSAQKATSTTLTGWTTTITAADILEFNLDSITTCTRVSLALKVQRS